MDTPLSSLASSGDPSHRAMRLQTFLGFLLVAGISLGLAFPLTLAGLPAFLGITGSFIFYRAEKRWPRIDLSLLLSILVFCALTLSSQFWSIAPQTSFERALKISALFLASCPFLFLCRELPLISKKILKKWAIWPLLLSATLLYIELKFSFPIYRTVQGLSTDAYVSAAILNKYVATLVLMAPLGLVFAWRSAYLSLSLLLMILVGLVLTVTEDNAAQLAVVVMIASVPFVISLPHAGPRIAFATIGFLIAFMPFIAPVAFNAFAEPLSHGTGFFKQANISMRLENWDFLARRILENPWTGFGMDTTRTMTFDTAQKYFPANTIIHPHNMALQIWIEFGVIGAYAALVFLGLLYRRLKTMTIRNRLLPFAVLGGVMVFLMISWSLWASWLDGFIFLLAGLLFVAAKPTSGPATS